MADYYLCPLGQVLEGVVPASVRGQAGTRERMFLSVPTNVAARLTQLKLPPKQAHILKVLAGSPRPMLMPELMLAAGCTAGPIKQLREKKLVVEQSKRVNTTELAQTVEDREAHLDLNEDQQQALRTILAMIDSGQHHTALMHGVTGSGKTEVYIRAIEHVISFGRQAIVLVPEISLTPQTVKRFRSRFDRVAVLHSHLSPADRHWQWRRIVDREVDVIVGARSAVFAPTPHLGLIVIDEEHDGSFKQDSPPGTKVARRRAQMESVPLVLGSATPSLESWLAAQRGGEYQLDSDMPPPFAGNLPHVGTGRLANEFHSRQTRGVRQTVAQAIHQTLVWQVILLLNRRVSRRRFSVQHVET
ncbi:MAG: DEAD/DEAH box helicase [Pirellulaceae bacterium]